MKIRIPIYLLKNSEKIYFILSRLVGLSVKAGFIWLLINNGYREDAYYITLYFLCLTSCMVLYNNESYYEYYKQQFEKKSSLFTINREKSIYLRHLVYHIAVLALVVLVFLYLLTSNFLISVTFAVLITLEKFIDEIKRHFLFSKEFTVWSNLFILQTVIPPLLAVIYIISGGVGGWVLYLVVLFFTVSIINLIHIPKRIILVCINYTKTINSRNLKDYFQVYKKKYFFNQLFAYTTSNILIFDKWMLLHFSQNTNSLASFYLISQLANIINLSIDYFYISTRRAFFIKKNLSISEIIDSGKIFIYGYLGFFIYIVSIVALLYISPNPSDYLTVTQSLIFGCCFFIFGITAPIQQNCFWNKPRVLLVMADLAFYISVIGCMYSISEEFGLMNKIILSTFTGHFFRTTFILYIFKFK
ncbi:hypothetical protein SAMN06298216_2274 [Spirosomataceae bacterium TFI 002]|nr:hypothetical protein SAMN06298216_2274 [Spirosomataceae bacterium TFI 002]